MLSKLILCLLQLLAHRGHRNKVECRAWMKNKWHTENFQWHLNDSRVHLYKKKICKTVSKNRNVIKYMTKKQNVV